MHVSIHLSMSISISINPKQMSVFYLGRFGRLGFLVANNVLLLQIRLRRPPCLAIMEVVVVIVSVVAVETRITIGIEIGLFDHSRESFAGSFDPTGVIPDIAMFTLCLFPE